MNRYLFIGEKPSKTAYERGWSWEDGRLAAKQLFNALEANGINPKYQVYMNLWRYNGTRLSKPELQRIFNFYTVQHSTIVVGMGKKVQEELNRINIEHIPIIHPAARGKIRKKHNYINHIKTLLIDNV